MSHQKIDSSSTESRGTFRIVLVLNALLAAGFLFTGVIADSNALLANGLDKK
jgi:divalent metal cation (Fe/Co/Zn/Cd) transporter